MECEICGSHYQRELLELLSSIYGARIWTLIEKLRSPPRMYAVRANTLRATGEEIVEFFDALGVRCRLHEDAEEAVLIEVGGPFKVRGEGKRVVAKKQAAESVMVGSNLYLPGVMQMDRMEVGDNAVVTDPRGHIVGNGRAAIHSGIRGNFGIAVETEESVYRLPPFRETKVFFDGKMQEQSLPAICTSKALDPQPQETIVDMCAAPGGKSAHIAQLQEDTGRIIAFEHSPRRIERMRRELARLGVRSVVIEKADSRYVDKDRPSLKADRVLVDPPCTALGVRPKLYEEATAAEVYSSAEFQKQFLRAAAAIVKPGGVVVYSTCTLSYQENEEVALFATDELGLELEEPPFVEKTARRGIGIRECLRFDPDFCDAPGYFIARFRKAR